MKEIRDALFSIAVIFTLLGALNWGLIGLFDIDLVKLIFPPSLVHSIYLLIGIMALYVIVSKMRLI